MKVKGRKEEKKRKNSKEKKREKAGTRSKEKRKDWLKRTTKSIKLWMIIKGRNNTTLATINYIEH